DKILPAWTAGIRISRNSLGHGVKILAGANRMFFGRDTINEVYHDGNAYYDKNGYLNTSKNPIPTLTTSDMADTVVNREDMTVTSGAVYREFNKYRKLDNTEYNTPVTINTGSRYPSVSLKTIKGSLMLEKAPNSGLGYFVYRNENGGNLTNPLLIPKQGGTIGRKEDIDTKRDLTDNEFTGIVQINCENDNTGTGIFFFNKDETTFRANIVANSAGLQLNQNFDGKLTNMTMPNDGSSGTMASREWVQENVTVDTSNLVSRDSITNELGDSKELVASQALLTDEISKITTGTIGDMKDVTSQRRFGVTYTNPYDRPLFLFLTYTGGDGVPTFVLSGVSFRVGGYSYGMSVQVPPKSTYRVLHSGVLEKWGEF
ncbi:MAG: hypothetical protein ACRC9P_06895, partial [Bacteroides sp.]